MKEKDFNSLSVQEQKDRINEFINSWYEQDPKNRCAVVILGDRENTKDPGKSSFSMLGPGALLAASINTSLKSSEPFRNFTTCHVLETVGKLLFGSNESKEDDD